METEKKQQNKVVQTYAGDMAKVIQANEAGMIKKIIHEKDNQEKVRENLSPSSNKNRTFMLISIVFVIIALGAVGFIVFLRQQTNTVPVAQQFVPLIFTDQTQTLEIGGLNKEKISQTVLNRVNSSKIKSGGIEGLYLTENKKIIGLRKFLSLIKANVDQTKMELVSDGFLMGVAKNEKNDLFILLKMRSFADIFPVLQGWENKMFYDLQGFFGVEISAKTNYLLTKEFEDGVVANKNARVLYDNDGKIVLTYIFADDNSVVITNSEEVAGEVMLRLASSKIKK